MLRTRNSPARELVPIMSRELINNSNRLFMCEVFSHLYTFILNYYYLHLLFFLLNISSIPKKSRPTWASLRLRMIWGCKSFVYTVGLWLCAYTTNVTVTLPIKYIH